MSHHPLKKTVQVGIQGKQIRGSSHTLSLVARIHEPHFACFKAECKVNLDAVCIIPPKAKKSSKLLKSDLIPPSLGHPMEFPCISRIFNKQSGIELCYYFVVLILLESHEFSQVFGSTSSHNLIKYHVMLSLHVSPINPLGDCHRLVLCNNDGLIEVLLKCHVKSIINPLFHLNKLKFSFLFSLTKSVLPS
jgi:hypothetical protein